jgi:menaquinone-dependent protoporphyrinogen oxidase
MPDVLVLYGSKHGHTAKIARRVAGVLEAEGVTPHLHAAAEVARLAPHDYDAVIVGASIHAGRYQREIVEWTKAHRTVLGTTPSAFFSVCLTAADDTDESRAATRRYVDQLLEQTGWTPRMTTTFAGALQYREYDFATRLVIRLMMHKGGHPTDVTRDYDYTDWEAVDRFAHACCGMIAPVALDAR